MIGIIGKAVTGKMLWIVGGIVAALLLAIAGMGWALDRANEKTAQAREEAAAAKQRAAQLTADLEHQVGETDAALLRYERLDAQFRALQATKNEIRTVVKRERVYIKEAKADDEAVEVYLDTPVPDLIDCLLRESCGDENGNPGGSSARGAD